MGNEKTVDDIIDEIIDEIDNDSDEIGYESLHDLDDTEANKESDTMKDGGKENKKSNTYDLMNGFAKYSPVIIGGGIGLYAGVKTKSLGIGITAAVLSTFISAAGITSIDDIMHKFKDTKSPSTEEQTEQ